MNQEPGWAEVAATGTAAFWRENHLRVAAVGGAIVFWWLVSSWVSEEHAEFLPGPGKVFGAIVEAFQTEGLGKALLGALYPMFAGYFLAVALGIPVGMMMGINRKLERLMDPYINGFFVAPISALIPAMIFWFGVGFQMRASVAFLFAVFVVIVNTLQGAKHTPGDFVELARSFGASRFFIAAKIALPSSIPYIMAGLRLAMGRAIVGIVIAELLVSVSGVGEIITNYSSAFRLDGVLGVALVIMSGGILLSGFMQWVENLIAPWKKKEAAFEEH
jgi:ABC-type nitrate/sulfonate/bicarbonate transport system permease component